MKTKYETPWLQIISFDEADVVTLSVGGFTGDYSNDNEEDYNKGWWN